MNESAPLIFAVAVPVVALLVGGWRSRDPAWVVGGMIAGYLILAVGVVWASGIGRNALFAALLAAAGVATMSQVEALWWRRRNR